MIEFFQKCWPRLTFLIARFNSDGLGVIEGYLLLSWADRKYQVLFIHICSVVKEKRMVNLTLYPHPAKFCFVYNIRSVKQHMHRPWLQEQKNTFYLVM